MAGLVISVVIQPVMAEPWLVKYGNDKGQVAVYNANTSKAFAEDQPYGPMSIRVYKDKLWVLDSIGGKLNCYLPGNKLASSLTIEDLPKNLLLEDFALVPGSSGEPETVWVAEAAECMVRKLSLSSGKVLVKIGGNGSEPGKFKQINQLEVDRIGRLYVGDIGKSVIAVFTAYGELIREIPWQRCGFALDSNSRLHTLRYSDSAGYFLTVYSVGGQLESSLHLGLAELTNPRVWAVSARGNLVVSFHPAGGFKGNLKLFEITPFGKIVKRMEFRPPSSMNRYLSGSDKTVWIANADFFSAPEGVFSVHSVKWGEKDD